MLLFLLRNLDNHRRRRRNKEILGDPYLELRRRDRNPKVFSFRASKMEMSYWLFRRWEGPLDDAVWCLPFAQHSWPSSVQQSSACCRTKSLINQLLTVHFICVVVGKVCLFGRIITYSSRNGNNLFFKIHFFSRTNVKKMESEMDISRPTLESGGESLATSLESDASTASLPQQQRKLWSRSKSTVRSSDGEAVTNEELKELKQWFQVIKYEPALFFFFSLDGMRSGRRLQEKNLCARQSTKTFSSRDFQNLSFECLCSTSGDFQCDRIWPPFSRLVCAPPLH